MRAIVICSAATLWLSGCQSEGRDQVQGTGGSRASSGGTQGSTGGAQNGTGGSTSSGTGGSPSGGTGGNMSSGTGGNTSSGTGGSTSSGTGGAGNEETPILDRPSAGTFTCRVSRDRTDHPPGWSSRSNGLAVGASSMPLVARLQGPEAMPFLSPELTVSTLALDGNLGPSLAVATMDATQIGAMAMAPRADGAALVWVDGTTLRFAAFDGAGAIVVAPRDVASGTVAFPDTTVRIAAGSDGGFGVFYAVPTTLTHAELRFLALDANGDARAPARLIVDGEWPAYTTAVAIGAAPDGYALVWRQPNGGRGRIDFGRVDQLGGESVAPRPISVTDQAGIEVGGVAGFDPRTAAVVRVDGGFLAAWPEIKRGTTSNPFVPPGGAGGWGVVRLVRLTEDGARLGTPVALRAPVADQDDVEPQLLAFAGRVAVLWGHGNRIYLCAGCVPDNGIEMMIVDPVQLVPLSNVATVTNGGAPKAGGLLARGAVVMGQAVLTTYNLTFHTTQRLGSAAFTCD
jgi:hypothetical protein